MMDQRYPTGAASTFCDADEQQWAPLGRARSHVWCRSHVDRTDRPWGGGKPPSPGPPQPYSPTTSLRSSDPRCCSKARRKRMAACPFENMFRMLACSLRKKCGDLSNSAPLEPCFGDRISHEVLSHHLPGQSRFNFLLGPWFLSKSFKTRLDNESIEEQTLGAKLPLKIQQRNCKHESV